MTITNRQSGTNVHEVADGIYRIYTNVWQSVGVNGWNHLNVVEAS